MSIGDRKARSDHYARRVGRWSMIVVLAMVLPLPTAAAGVRALPQPANFPGAQTRWVAERWSLNGLPISIRWFLAPAPASEVLRFYSRSWQGEGGSTARRMSHRGLQSFGAELDGHYYSVQVRDVSGGSEGFLVVSASPGQETEDRSTTFPMPPGDRVIQKMEALDLGIRSESLIVRTELAPHSALRSYRSELLRDRWTPVGLAHRSNQDGRPLWFQKGAQHCQVTVMEEGPGQGAKVLIHWVKESDEAR